jgi:hypothetical protein
MKKKHQIDQAAETLAGIVEKHLATLSPEEQKASLTAFTNAVSSVRDSHAKPEGPQQTPASRRAVL